MEAKITCTCSRIVIADMDLTLRKGDTLYVEAGRSKASKDLQRAWKNKAVAIRYVQRFQEQRAAPIPNPSTPDAVRRSAFIPDQKEEAIVDPDAIASRVVEALGRGATPAQVRTEVARQLQVAKQEIVADVVSALKAEIGAGIRVGAAPAAAVARPAGKVVVEDDVPVFVPSKIGRDDLSGDIETTTTQVEGATGVSDAAAALRAARDAAGKKR